MNFTTKSYDLTMPATLHRTPCVLHHVLTIRSPQVVLVGVFLKQATRKVCKESSILLEKGEVCEKRMAKSFSDSYKATFKEKFPEIVRELTESALQDPEIADGMQHLQKVYKYCSRFNY